MSVAPGYAASRAHDDVSSVGTRTRAVAALIVNGEPQGDAAIVWHEGVVWVPVEVLRAAGVRVDDADPQAVTINRVLHVAPARLGPGLRVEWDEHDVALRLTVPPSLLPTHVIELSSNRPAGLVKARPTSLFVNYAATAESGALALAIEGGLSLHGRLLRTSVARGANGRWIRGTTALTMDDERRLLRWEVGDAVLTGGSIGGAAPVIGVTLSREFAIDPYFVRYAPLTLTGAAMSASTAEIYVNGQLVAREAIAPGAFTLQGVPASVGAGRTEVILRDAFGREQRLGSSFYQPVTLLRRGLHRFRYGIGVPHADALSQTLGARASAATPASGDTASASEASALATLDAAMHQSRALDAAAVRASGSIASESEAAALAVLDAAAQASSARRTPSYTGIAAVGEHHIGVCDWLTVGGRAEATDRLVGVSPGVAVRVPVGEVEIAVAASHAEARTGGALVTGWTYRGRAASAGVSLRRATEAYRALGLSRALPAIRDEVQAQGGLSLPRGVSLVLQHASGHDWAGGRSQRSAVSTSYPVLRRASLTASVGRIAMDGRPRLETFVGINVRAGSRGSIDAGSHRVGGRGTQTVAYQRSLPIGPGVGARVQWQDGAPRDVDAVLQAQTRVARVELRHAAVGRLPSSRAASGVTRSIGASVMGAIVALDGRVYATRPVDDAFGVVRVPRVPGVRAYVSRQYVGRTDRRGDLVVPGLVSYYGNRVSIEPADVPLDRYVGVEERVVAPAWRGGALVQFAASTVRAVVGRVVVVIAGRTFVPAFGDVELIVGGRQIASPIGTRGEFYIEDLGPGWQRIVVRYAGSAYPCAFQVPDDARVAGQPIDVGLVTCHGETMRAGGPES